jgi:ATP-dependent exoDNAse (exonuclease V) alpha subunit
MARPRKPAAADSRPDTMLSGDIVVKGKPKFYEERTRYAIVEAIVPSKDPNKVFIFKGVLDHPTDGTAYSVKGYMEYDETRKSHYFKIKHSELKEQTSPQGWVEYLLREGPNLGDVRAQQLVAKFGNQVVQILANDPDQAMAIEGLTPARLQELTNWAKEELLLADTKKMLYGLGFTPGIVRRLIVQFGRDTTRIIKSDPFQTMDIEGIGFITASKIAEAVGCSRTNPRRVKCGIIHVMREHADEGHTCIIWDRLVEKAQRLLGVGRDLVIAMTKELITEEKLCTQRSNPRKFAKNPHLFPAPVQ